MDFLANSEDQLWCGRSRCLHKPRWYLCVKPADRAASAGWGTDYFQWIMPGEHDRVDCCFLLSMFSPLFVLFRLELRPLSYQDPCFPLNLRILPPALPLSLSACFRRPLSYLVPSPLSQAIQIGQLGADVFFPGSSTAVWEFNNWHLGYWKAYILPFCALNKVLYKEIHLNPVGLLPSLAASHFLV